MLFVVGIAVMLLWLATPTHAVTYYVDDIGGNDANTGTTEDQAWQSIYKIYRSTFQAGDTILFKKGGHWRMAEGIQRSTYFVQKGAGTEGKPVTYSSYGEGAMPILDALSLFDDPNGWSQQTGDVWKYAYSYGSDMVANGDFETWNAGTPDAWTRSADMTVSQETVSPYAGSSSLRLAAASGNQYVQQSFAVEPGKTYRYEAYLKTEGASQVLAGIYSGSGSILYSSFTSYAEWTKVSRSFVVPSGISQISFRFYVSGGVAFVDNASLTRSNGIGDIGRVFVDGTAVGKADSVSAVGEQKKYFWDAVNKELYLYSPSGNPAQQYTNPGVEGSDLPRVFDSANKPYITIDGLEFRGGRGSGVMFFSTEATTESEQIHFKNSRITYYAGSGLVFQGSTPHGIHHSTITNNYIDPFLHASENSLIRGGGVLGDSIKLAGSASYNHIAHNTVIECSHTILELVAVDAQYGGVNHNIVEYNTVSAPVSNYCRGVGVAGVEGKMDGNIIRYNYIHDTSVRNQINGTNTQFHNNIIMNTVGTPLHTRLDGEGIGLQTWNCSGTPCTSSNVSIFNNTVVNTVSTGITLYPSDDIAMAHNKITNNIVHNTDTAYSNATFRVRRISGDITATDILHNIFHSPLQSDTINYYDTIMTTDDFGRTAPLYGDTIANNTDHAPQFSAAVLANKQDVYPSWNSPAIDTGTDVGLTTDIHNNPIYGNPDIGAYEYQPPYTMGQDTIDHTANIRLYGDGKFRNTKEPHGTAIPLSIKPTSNNTRHYADLTIDTWTEQQKTWTLHTQNMEGTITNTITHLSPTTHYKITTDIPTSCHNQICHTNQNGTLTFTTQADPNTKTTFTVEQTELPTPTTPIYRFYSQKHQAHFYTTSKEEKDYIQQIYATDIWNYEGIAYHALTHAIENATPIYRFYSQKNNKHFYTISEKEKHDLINSKYPEAHFTYEGIAWYAHSMPQSFTTPLYRFYSQKNAVHFYTASQEEKEHIQNTYSHDIWHYEGIAWYGVR